MPTHDEEPWANDERRRRHDERFPPPWTTPAQSPHRPLGMMDALFFAIALALIVAVALLFLLQGPAAG